MSTTSLKLSEELKQRAAKAAQEFGISPHAFMVEAIRQAADAVEQRPEFVEQALSARADMRESGLGHDAKDVREYLRRRLTDKDAPRPGTKAWRK